MKWNKNSSSITLEPQDMVVMAQCKMPVREMLRRERPNENIPPLWSVLSYVMLQHHCSAGVLWSYYRHYIRLAKSISSHYYRGHIPKANGGVRILHIPHYSVHLQQSFIANNILCGLPVDPHAYAYRKGCSIQDCAKPHVGRDVLIHLDLKNFFGSITENMVYDTFLRETGYAESLCRFLARLCCLNGSLPQGTVSSPMLSNIVFRPWDEKLTALEKKYGLKYSRYCDDIFLSGSADTDVNAVIREVSQILDSGGFKLNQKKIRVRRRQHRQTVLGLTVNQHLQVTRQYRRELMQELYYLERFGQDCKGAKECGDYLKYMQQLQGRLAYVIHTDPHNAKLQQAHDRLIRRIKEYADLRKAEVSDIIASQRSFLYAPYLPL